MQLEQLENGLRTQFDAIRERVRKHCLRVLKNAELAEDAAQDAMVNAWHRRATYRSDSPLEHWIMRIATNACLDILRCRHTKPTTDFDEARSPQSATHDPEIRNVELRVLLDQVLPPLRECMGEQNYWIWQQKIAGATEEQIAHGLPARWKLSKDGVHSRVQRNIKACLDKIRLLHGRELAGLPI